MTFPTILSDYGRSKTLDTSEYKLSHDSIFISALSGVFKPLWGQRVAKK